MLWTVVLEKALESPLGCKEIKPVNPKENQSWIFIGRTDDEAEAPILWLPDEKNWFIGKDPDAGKDWRQDEMGTTEDEMVGWHHRLNWHEFEQAPGVGDGQGSLVCCSSWGHKESNTTELNLWGTCLVLTVLMSKLSAPSEQAGNVMFSASSCTRLPRTVLCCYLDGMVPFCERCVVPC